MTITALLISFIKIMEFIPFIEITAITVITEFMAFVSNSLTIILEDIINIQGWKLDGRNGTGSQAQVFY